MHHEPTMKCVGGCGGSGKRRGSAGVMDCPRCKGTGRITADQVRPGEVAGL
ncbi:hypothetical protein [Nonomuraea sp. SYSU D8015]|uniref:hypothetical protein n=1 Tax=Nonomuraea sp. SYSU D8015 TaxID=2593644 RepID=UPI0016603E97|nr:hypothetical protein [Nonomuraea sp. SYSU D8015]